MAKIQLFWWKDDSLEVESESVDVPDGLMVSDQIVLAAFGVSRRNNWDLTLFCDEQRTDTSSSGRVFVLEASVMTDEWTADIRFYLQFDTADLKNDPKQELTAELVATEELEKFIAESEG